MLTINLFNQQQINTCWSGLSGQSVGTSSTGGTSVGLFVLGSNSLTINKHKPYSDMFLGEIM